MIAVTAQALVGSGDLAGQDVQDFLHRLFTLAVVSGSDDKEHWFALAEQPMRYVAEQGIGWTGLIAIDPRDHDLEGARDAYARAARLSSRKEPPSQIPRHAQSSKAASESQACYVQGLKPRVSTDSVRRYYEATLLDYRILWMGSSNRAIHFGYWAPGVTSPDLV